MDKKLVSGIIAGIFIGFIIAWYVLPSFTSWPMMGGYGGMMNGYRSGMMGSGNGYRAMGDIDVHFIEQMIPHHEGAIAMAELALERSTRPEIRSLATGIIEAQNRENDDMRAWYADWFGGAPESISGMHGMMNMMGGTGDLAALRTAADFDREFIEQMIPHHEMAIMMAGMLAAATGRDEMRELADQIITSQSREVKMMRSWHESWY